MIFNIKRNKLIIFLLLSSILLVIYALHVITGNQYIGINVERNNQGEYSVTEVTPDGWGDLNHVEKGSKILKVDGKNAEENIQVLRFNKVEQIQSLTIEQDYIVREFSIPPLLINKNIINHIIYPLLVYLLCVGCCIFIYQKKGNSKSALFLCLFLLAVSLGYLSAGASTKGDIFSRFINIFFFLSIPTFYIHFILSYFEELNERWFTIQKLYFSYGLIVFNLLLEMCFYFVGIPFSIVKFINLISFLLLMVLVFFILIRGQRKIRSTYQYMIKMLLWTNIFTFSPFILFYIIPYIFTKESIFNPSTLAVLLLIIPLTLVYLLLSEKIYDIDFFINRVRYYMLLALVPTVFLVSIMVFYRESNNYIELIKMTAFLYTTLLITFYLKELFDFKLGFNKFSEKFNYQDGLLRYTQSIKKANSVHDLLSELKLIVSDVLLITNIYVVKADQDNQFIVPNKEVEKIRHYFDGIIGESSKVGDLRQVNKGFIVNIGGTEKMSYHLIGYSSGYLILNRDAILWLKSIAFYTNIALENFLKIEDLIKHLKFIKNKEQNPHWLSKLFISIKERQRSDLAKDLHDSVLQELISLKRACENNVIHNEKDCVTVLNNLSKHINKLIDMTRETCNELRPQVLYDLGFVNAIEKLVEQHESISDIEIRFNKREFYEYLEFDTQLALFRIIQELLNNARKHSRANNILLLLVNIKGKFILQYEDDGIGIDRKTRMTSNGMGLSSIKERVNAINGTLRIHSEDGLSVQIEL